MWKLLEVAFELFVATTPICIGRIFPFRGLKDSIVIEVRMAQINAWALEVVAGRSGNGDFQACPQVQR